MTWPDGSAAWEVEAAEIEALFEALDEFGLDSGELWRLIEEERRKTEK